jgi:ABC-type Zn2+ transport system substrate-binding protein/surface adhesin
MRADLRLRMIRHFVHLLVAAFVFAQFAGVVASPLASAEALATAALATAAAHHDDHAHAHHHHGGAGAHHQGDQHDQDTDHADQCCALHAFFAGVLPPVIAADLREAAGQRLTPHFADIGVGVGLGRLDRPPRPLHLI